MIWNVIQISLRRLKHNRVELLLTFVVPIAFFSVFALIFGKGIGSGATPKVKAVVVDELDSPDSRQVLDALRGSAGLRIMDDLNAAADDITASDASQMVRRGTVTIGIVLKPDADGEITAELLADASDQVAGQVVSALVGREIVIHRARRSAQQQAVSRQSAQQAAVLDSPLQTAESSVAEETFRLAAARLPDSASTATTEIQGAAGGSESIELAPPGTASIGDAEALFDASEISAVKVVDVLGSGKSNPVVSMYAAGIAVMFLLFGATGGGGALLEERENTTLDRLLSTQLTMDQLLLGKWFYLTLLGFVQVAVMFVWGQVAFGVDLLGHLDGFVMMTLVTSSAAAAFGLLLATLCRTRGQLNGLSVILILTMSALGGSMVPRYVMSEPMRKMGQWTFNAWALDGYDKVFWRDLPVDSLWPQLGVLMAAGVSFLLIARALATRWECD